MGFFYDDRPGKSIDDDDASEGFPVVLSRARLMAWLCAFSLVGFLAWVLK